MAGGAVAKAASFTVSGLMDHNRYVSGEFHVCHNGVESRGKTIQIDSDGWVQTFPIEKGSAACKRS